jgi:hypothetical protein
MKITNRILFTIAFLLSTRTDDGGVDTLALSTALACGKSGVVDGVLRVLETRREYESVERALKVLVGIANVHLASLGDGVAIRVRVLVEVGGLDAEERKDVEGLMSELETILI